MQEAEQVLSPKNEQNQSLEKLKDRNPAYLADVAVAQSGALSWPTEMVGRLAKSVRFG